MDEFEDKNLTCICGAPFVWTAGEQDFMQDLLEKGKFDRVDKDTGENIPGEVMTPKRCVPCRRKKKEERENRGLGN